MNDANKKTNHVILPVTGPYTAKDQAKSDQTNKFIGCGSRWSSTEKYRQAWGSRANCGSYQSTDVVFISAEGNRAGALEPDFQEIGRAISAGACLITDDKSNRLRPYNTGERSVAEYLRRAGYQENPSGVWTKPLASGIGIELETVVNKKSFAGSAILIGRPSVFGNPFSHLRHSRAEVIVPDRYTAIMRFAGWLITGIDPDLRRSPQPIRDAIHRGELDNELPLMCFCAPLACHGDVLDEVRTAEKLTAAIVEPAEFLGRLEVRIQSKC